MFRTVPLSIIRSFSLYTQEWYMSYRFADSLRAGSRRNWFHPDDGQRNCLKCVEFYSKNKFEKLVHLVGFIIRIYHDARSPEHQNFRKWFTIKTNSTSQIKTNSSCTLFCIFCCLFVLELVFYFGVSHATSTVLVIRLQLLLVAN